MSKSQTKRLHEQQELEKAAAQSQVVEEEEGSEVQRRGPANRFAFFDDDGNSDEEKKEESDGKEDQDEEVKEVNAKKKNDPKKNKNKKKKNKNKKKEDTADSNNFEPEETEGELLDRMVRQNTMEAENGSSTVAAPAVELLMKVDPKMFDPMAELKKLLGKTFRDEANSSSAQDSRHNRFKPVGRIVKSKTSWPPVRSIGLSMVHAKDEEDLKWFKFVHNSHYEEMERMYWFGEDSMDVNVAQEILIENGYHLNSLIMMANMMRMQEDVNRAADAIEQGIFYCEQIFAAQFQPFSWKHRLDYLDYENRAFYLLLHRHMMHAAGKRCFETALNTAKMIFKMDPQRDPLAINMLFDTLAIKARKYDWLLQVYESASNWKNLMLLPNWKYSVAMAKFLSAKTDKEVEEANEALKFAIRAFPTVVTEILDALQIHPDSLIMNHESFSAYAANRETDGMKMVTKIYVNQASELWKVPETLSWLETVTREVASNTTVSNVTQMKCWAIRRQKMYSGMAPNVARLAVVLGLAEAKSLTDPIPPINGRSRYKREDHVEQLVDDSTLGAFLHSFYPNFDREHNFRESLERNLANLSLDLRNQLSNLLRRATSPGAEVEIIPNPNPQEEPEQPDQN